MMKKVLRIALYIIGGIVGLVVVVFAFAVWDLSRGHDEFTATRNDLPSYVAGRWDWTSRTRPCTDSAHTITFANDGRVMEIRQESDTGKGGASDPTVYDIL